MSQQGLTKHETDPPPSPFSLMTSCIKKTLKIVLISTKQCGKRYVKLEIQIKYMYNTDIKAIL